MFAYPYLANHGFSLYRDYVHPYPPLLTLTLAALFKTFGYKVIILKAVSYLLFLASDVIIYLTIKKLGRNAVIALVFTCAYAFLQPFLDGNMLWFDTAITPFVLSAFYFLIQKKFIKGSLFLTIALFIKQTSILFFVVFLLYLFFKKAKRREYIEFLAIPFVTGMLFLSCLALKTDLNWFINWTLLYPATGWGKVPGYVQMNLTFRQFAILVLLFAPIFVAFKKLKISTLKLKDEKLILLLIFLLASLFAIYPRFSFFHFQTAFAFLVITLAYLYKKSIVIRLFLALAAVLIIKPRLVDFHSTTRFYSSDDISLAQKIADDTKPGDKVLLLGVHAQIHTLADRLPPKPWGDNFPWYWQMSNFEEEAVLKWETEPPKYVYKVENGGYYPPKITNWLETNYTKGKEIENGIFEWKRKS